MKTIKCASAGNGLKVAIVIAATGLLAGNAQADLSYFFSNAGVFSGTVPVGPGTTPYAEAVFSQNGTDQVTLTMSVLTGTGLPAGSFVNDWYFNIDPTQTTTIAWASGVQAKSLDLLSQNAYFADGGGAYDFAFHFTTAGNVEQQLAIGATSVYSLEGTGLTESDFLFLAAPHGGNGVFNAAVHVQGYGNSAWLAGGPSDNTCPPEAPGTFPICFPNQETPEPGSIALLGLGLAGLAASRRRRPV